MKSRYFHESTFQFQPFQPFGADRIPIFRDIENCRSWLTPKRFSRILPTIGSHSTIGDGVAEGLSKPVGDHRATRGKGSDDVISWHFSWMEVRRGERDSWCGVFLCPTSELAGHRQGLRLSRTVRPISPQMEPRTGRDCRAATESDQLDLERWALKRDFRPAPWS